MAVAGRLFAKSGAIDADTRAIRLDVGEQLGCGGVQFLHGMFT
jgi:hypothetical protein